MTILPFTCPRSCRWAERQDLCRFTPMLARIGVCGRVTSHTTTVAVEIRSTAALAAAVLRLGGTVVGEGRHALYSTTEQGFAVTLPGWRYPLVLRTDGQMAIDTYNGRWGDPADLKRLQGVYALEAAREAAAGLGWMVLSEGDDHIVIAHPEGGAMTVHADGRCEAAGFCGRDCHATAPIEEAIGRPVERMLAPEYFQERAHVRAREDEP